MCSCTQDTVCRTESVFSVTVPTCSTAVSVMDQSSVAFLNCCCSTAFFTSAAALLTSARPKSSSSDCTHTQHEKRSDDSSQTRKSDFKTHFKRTICPVVCYSQSCRGTAPTSWRSLWRKTQFGREFNFLFSIPSITVWLFSQAQRRKKLQGFKLQWWVHVHKTFSCLYFLRLLHSSFMYIFIEGNLIQDLARCIIINWVDLVSDPKLFVVCTFQLCLYTPH